MNTFLSRANTIFAFTLSVMAALTFGCFLTTAFSEHKAPINISTAKAIVKNVPDYSASREKNDLGFITFDLEAELTPLFNWNVKQLFLYLTAEYTTATNENVTTKLTHHLLSHFGSLPVGKENVTTSQYVTVPDAYRSLAHVKEINQVVLWDKIIQRGENAKLDYRSMNTKYYFWDDGNGLKNNKNVTLTLSWNVIPNAGALPKILGSGNHRFEFPDEYTTSRF